MLRFLIVLGIIAACIYFIVTKTDLSIENNLHYRPVNKQEIFDFKGAQQKAIERQKRIDNGEF